ncbi:hypothetical protein U1Q18_048953 [Sarracenia purpurea var. burkii]
MASFRVPCPKSSSPCTTSESIPKQNHNCSVSFQSSSSAFLAGSSLRFQGLKNNKSDVFKVFAQLSDVAIEKSSNSAPVLETNPEELVKESAAQLTVPDASSISALMTQVAEILKQLDCELIIRKKEALQQQHAAPVVMMQPHSSQAMVPSQLPPPQARAPAFAGPVSSPHVSSPVPALPTKPKSSHPPLKCPMAGTFYRSPAPGAPAFVKIGDKIQKGQVVCIIEAMKLMNEIEADQSGTVVEVLVDDGKSVSVDTPLFMIEP